jgi:hypothetical protein
MQNYCYEAAELVYLPLCGALAAAGLITIPKHLLDKQ